MLARRPPIAEVASTCDSDGTAITEAGSCTWKTMPRERVAAFLQPYGYLANNALDWRSSPPELTLQVVGHSVVEGHTLYSIECSLGPPAGSDRNDLLFPGPGAGPDAGSSSSSSSGPRLAWRAERRLAELRAGLYDQVKKALGSSYSTYFCKVHFAHRLRPSGTTARLDAWCGRLAYCINMKLLPPLVAAETLRLLDAPVPAAASTIAKVAPQPTSKAPARPLLEELFLIQQVPDRPREEAQPQQQEEQQKEEQQLKAETQQEACSLTVSTLVAEGADAKASVQSPSGSGTADWVGGDAGSTCTGGDGSSSARGVPEGEWDSFPAAGLGGATCEEEEEDSGAALIHMQPAELAIAQPHLADILQAECSEEDEVDDDELTDGVLAGLPGLDDL